MSEPFKLPRFTRALESMGAELIPPRLALIQPTRDPIEIELRRGIEIKQEDIKNLEVHGEDELFGYKGYQVVLYIERPFFTKDRLEEDLFELAPRFHLKRCQKLQEMDEKNRFELRYRMTNNKAGVFNIVPYDQFSGTHLENENFESWLPVCKFCLRDINYENYSDLAQHQKNAFVEAFDLEKFFSENASFFSKADTRNIRRAETPRTRSGHEGRQFPRRGDNNPVAGPGGDAVMGTEETSSRGAAGSTTTCSGTVKWFNPIRYYGFIMPDEGGKDIFVHMTAVKEAGLASLTEGQQVNYKIVTDDQGKTHAVNLSLVDD